MVPKNDGSYESTNRLYPYLVMKMSQISIQFDKNLFVFKKKIEKRMLG
jgi:hypothetical protein